jgi:uncharacterized protein with HEPN domain
MRPEKLYLSDIFAASEAIERFCSSVDESQFLTDELRQSAILQKLILIGEAASHLSDEFRESHPDIEWGDIIGFRNIAVHEYFAIMWEIVWATAKYDIPELITHIQEILGTEFIDE